MVLGPVIPEKGLVMLYAARGTGKTFVGLDGVDNTRNRRREPRAHCWHVGRRLVSRGTRLSLKTRADNVAGDGANHGRSHLTSSAKPLASQANPWLALPLTSRNVIQR